MRAHAWTARLGLGLLLFAFVAGACTVTNPPEGSGSPGAGANRDTIVIGMSQEPDTLFNPISSMQVQTNVYVTLNQGLTVRDQENVYQPRLAKTTPTLENGGAKLANVADGKQQITVTYNIRDNAKFSNGMPVTSADIKYSWQLYLDNNVPIVSRVTAQKYQEIQTPDDKTAVVVY